MPKRVLVICLVGCLALVVLGVTVFLNTPEISMINYKLRL